MSVSSFNNTIATITCVLTMPLTATANSRWIQNHPCRAAQLHSQDRQIRREERLMARQNGGHTTRLEQIALNQQENQVSKK